MYRTLVNGIGGILISRIGRNARQIHFTTASTKAKNYI